MKKTSKRIQICFLTFSGISAVFALGHFAHAFSGQRPKTADYPFAGARREPDPRTEQWLSTVNREGYLGFDFETEDRQLSLKEDANEFLQFVKKPISQRKYYDPSDCEAGDPFCVYMTDPGAMGLISGGGKRVRRPRPARGNWKVTAKILATGNLEKISALPDRQIGYAIHHLDSFDGLEKASQAVLEKKGCENASLSYFLGLKAEEFLPDESFRKKAIGLYEIAARCAPKPQTMGLTPDQEIQPRAMYRYSLLQIWSNHCDLALPFLSELSQPALSAEYRPRALYYSYVCGMQVGSSDSKALALKAKDTLYAVYPFGLHTLLLQKDEPGRVKSILSIPDSIVRYRSVKTTDLNDAIASAETLIRMNEFGWARHILASINQRADASEPEFQMYLAYLYQKVGDPISKFRTLTVAFRDNAQTISRTALALYYPRNQDVSVDVIRSTGVNELVVMSLIRQESAFNERARSPAGAVGLMQVLPRTARLMEHRRSGSLFDPNNNVRIGSKYFSTLLKRYDGDTELALAAYNAGPERVEQWVKRYNVPQRTLFLDLIPFKETRDYVASIARNYFWYSVLYPEPRTPAADTEATQLTAWDLSRGIGSVFKTFGT